MKYLLSMILCMLSFSSFAAPEAKLWAFWDAADAGNNASLSHQPWQQFLNKYLVQHGEDTLVRYSQVSGPDHNRLKGYLDSLSQIDPRRYSRAEQYAYWVNLYNALTVDLILDNYPLSSITELGGFFSFGPWDEEGITIDGKALTLNDIEHRILRPIWQDPRTHYAVNCASLGCPNLQNTAFTAENREQLLEHAADRYINSTKGMLLTGETMQLSSIYDWFAADFGGRQGVIRHLQQYRADPPPTFTDIEIEYDYDWSLNEAR